MNEADLKDGGWIKQPDGSWSKGARAVRAVEADRAQPPAVSSLDGGKPKRQGRKASVGGSAGTVTMIMLRHRLLDPDAVAAACKPLTDSVAAFLGVDDADPAWFWEWGQQRTDGEEGVLVKIEYKQQP